jgi:hypothetical protein
MMRSRKLWKATKQLGHRVVDPLLTVPQALRLRPYLRQLADGEHRVTYPVPFYAQFASPELIEDIIYRRLDARQDPRWREFGAWTLEEYELWSWRACGIVCLKMVVEAAGGPQKPIMEWVDEGLALDGYRLYDARGRWIVEGWFYWPLICLAARYGLAGQVLGNVPAEEVCRRIESNRLVVASARTGANIGGHPGVKSEGGHLVVATGFGWHGGRCTHVVVNNPSGGAGMREQAEIPFRLFAREFAGRLMTFWPDNSTA